MKRLLKSIKAIISTPWSRRPGAPAPREPVILPRDRHNISRKNIDPEALKVLYRLRKFQHTSYLVGGGVRDLLLGIPPEDFDISTSAHPGQVKKIFTNCRLVGKRFRLAHILFRGKFIEVATFRRQSEFDLEEKEKEDLLIRSDNTYGTPEDDAFRRDFTINALFYGINDFSVIDYVGGLKDLESKVVRSIGDPNIRFREDPIRMLRAIRLASRLDFEIEPEALAAIGAHRAEIWKGATPRILEELQRIMRGGHSRRAFSLLMETGLLDMLMPELTIVLVSRGQAPGFWKQLEAVDRLVQGGKHYSFAVLYAALMSHVFRSKLENTRGKIDYHSLVEESVAPIAQRLGVPKRDTDRARAVLMAQRRFSNIGRRGFHPAPLVEKQWFPEALDLFEIWAHANPENLPLLDRWRRETGRGIPQERPREGGARREPPEARGHHAGPAHPPQGEPGEGGKHRRRRSRPRRRRRAPQETGQQPQNQ